MLETKDAINLSGQLNSNEGSKQQPNAGSRHFSADERLLWQRIQQHDFEPDHPLNFTERFARDHGWDLPNAREAIEAYRRFCFLAIVSPTQVTPSEVVDEVWHQHLIYSRDYWDIWCGQVLRKPLHHDPTPGGPEAHQLYRRQYAQTLALHERYFGPPDSVLWPATHQRFGALSLFRIIDTNRMVVMPNPIAYLRSVFWR